MTSLEKEILESLIASETVVSGSYLAKSFGVSRTAIWKAIQRLKEEGYEILTQKRGYLLKTREILSPSKLKSLLEGLTLWERVIYRFCVPSTMDLAKDLAEKGIKALVLAERQILGRGRLGRSWLSDLGGLWITLIIKEKKPLKEGIILPFISSLAVARALKEAYGLRPSLKWPNDVLLNERKVAGILLELKGETDQIDYALIGIGVNLNNPISSQPFEQLAISVSEYLGQKVDRYSFLKRLLFHFEKLYTKVPFKVIISEWKELSSTLGRRVKVRTQSHVIEGEAIDLTEEGALLILREGEIIKVYSGDCFHLREG